MKGYEGYSGILADLYDLWASYWMDYDTAAYQRAMQEVPGRALELGCGTALAAISAGRSAGGRA